jgi:type IV pilus assembly protein PilY1
LYFSRVPGAMATSNADQYHTVLVTGMRGGGNGYIALDVTNPTDPKFLWQFTDPDMGKTFAQPALAQATFQDAGGTVKNGAIAILSGGVGVSGPSGDSGDCINGATNPPMKTNGSSAFRTNSKVTGTPDIDLNRDVRCWRTTGRALYFIDVETGELIKKIFKDSAGRYIFNSPIVSTPSIFQSDIGTRASRAFVTDADGVIWRIDLSSTVPDALDGMKGWTARPFHDIFWDRSPTQGELSYEAPIISVDDLGRLVVIVGTGDTDNFLKTTVQNRVVSLTEILDTTGSPPFPEEYRAAINWEKRVKANNGLVTSELVTGSMGLFARQLYFGTFISVTSANKCDYGAGRVHAVDYIQKDPNDANGSTPETYGPLALTGIAADSDSASLINKTAADAVPNLMIMGLGVTQRPSCELAQPSVEDPWMGKIPVAPQTSDPALYLVAQGSGEAGQLLRANAGGRLLNVELKINRPKTPARVVSWATSVD